MRSLGNDVKTNPLPIALIAAALGWLMVGQRRPEARADSPSIVPDDSIGPGGKSLNERFDDWARNNTAEVAGATRDSTQGAGERAWNAFDGARDSAEQATSTARDGNRPSSRSQRRRDGRRVIILRLRRSERDSRSRFIRGE